MWTFTENCVTARMLPDRRQQIGRSVDQLRTREPPPGSARSAGACSSRLRTDLAGRTCRWPSHGGATFTLLIRSGAAEVDAIMLSLNSSLIHPSRGQSRPTAAKPSPQARQVRAGANGQHQTWHASCVDISRDSNGTAMRLADITPVGSGLAVGTPSWTRRQARPGPWIRRSPDSIFVVALRLRRHTWPSYSSQLGV
jgi:hypothetical protein